MGINVSSLSRSGLRDWLIQRMSALIMLAYIIVLAVYFLAHPHMAFTDWQQLFQRPWMQIFSLIFLLSIMLHAYIGIWTVLTDYVKSIHLRLLLEVLVLLALIVYLVWGIKILWGV